MAGQSQTDSTLTSQRHPKILEIGNYPPPQCGWAMQTKLLAEELRRHGAVCEVMNINESRKIKSREYVDVQNGPDYLWKLFKFALCGYRFHMHANAESWKGYLLALAAQLIGRAFGRPAILTFHGGLPQSYFPRPDSRLLKFAYRLLFLTAGRITCDNAEIKQAIESYGLDGRRPVAPFACFSPCYLDFQQRPLEPVVLDFLRGHHPVFFCNVCFRPEYGLGALLDSMARFTRRCAAAGFIWLGFPRKELARARDFLDGLPGGPPINLLLLGNLGHDAFLTLLTRSTAFIRPPACDGVAASVLESLALGVPVVAAENGRRPLGVLTYRFADSADLYEKLCYLMENYEAIRGATRLEASEPAVEQAAEWLLQPERAVTATSLAAHDGQ